MEQRMELSLVAVPTLFYALGEGFALFKEVTDPCTVIVDQPIPLNGCMFDAFWLRRVVDNERVGYWFRSQFHTVNRGTFVVAHLNSQAGKAANVEVMLKTDHLIIYNYPNKGTLLLCPQANQRVQEIFEEQ
ncbi:hypothetical protein [Ralstonia phage phiRSL1]|uniref:Uncharacterized protein n=1 Tax=Ralstonia phage phiRSL1 TaxID=1980924 RepID=B2ZY16_9CAUD|nr:hypothetical protein RSL1_ORF156 [Ralstonia phage phiRSL1]BAG41602.1 hypothetical protein [Ralstonia phage phiRSL1]